MGDFEVSTQVEMESTVEYHPAGIIILTLVCYLDFFLGNFKQKGGVNVN